jgi:hypothetical protein
LKFNQEMNAMEPNRRDIDPAWGSSIAQRPQIWPSLPLPAWQESCETLNRWMQMVGKVRLKLTPAVNHWWHVPLYVTARGLSTALIPYGQRMFEIRFDFCDHRLVVETGEGEQKTLPLQSGAVADFYGEFMEMLQLLDIKVKIWPVPVEVTDSTPFYQDRRHKKYDPDFVNRFWQILVQTERVMQQFRSRFLGKCSPIHFFWGGFDLALTRFSGRPAPRHPPVANLAEFVAVEAYSHEVSSCGFWPGGGAIQEPAYYAYAYPEPEGFKDFPIRCDSAFYSQELHEFILPYDAVRAAQNPDEQLLSFFQSTYEAAAVSGHWDREALERE